MKFAFRTIIVVLVLIIVAAIFLGIYFPVTGPWYRAKYPEDKYEMQVILFKQHICSADIDSQNVCMVDRFKLIYPFWMGTSYNINGNSEIPGKGHISEKYLVATILCDMQLDTDRTRLSKLQPIELIQTFIDQDHISFFKKSENTGMVETIKENGPALYIVEMDAHIGFILNDGNASFVIYSKTQFPYCVVKENLSDASIILDANNIVVGCLSKSAHLQSSE